MRLLEVKRTDAGLFIDEPDRPVGAYWVKLKTTGEMAVATYDMYDATEDVDLDAVPDGVQVSMEAPVYGFGWCLNQDPEEEWRLVQEDEFEFIGCLVPEYARLVAILRFVREFKPLAASSLMKDLRMHALYAAFRKIQQ